MIRLLDYFLSDFVGYSLSKAWFKPLKLPMLNGSEKMQLRSIGLQCKQCICGIFSIETGHNKHISFICDAMFIQAILIIHNSYILWKLHKHSTELMNAEISAENVCSRWFQCFAVLLFYMPASKCNSAMRTNLGMIKSFLQTSKFTNTKPTNNKDYCTVLT